MLENDIGTLKLSLDLGIISLYQYILKYMRSNRDGWDMKMKRE